MKKVTPTEQQMRAGIRVTVEQTPVERAVQRILRSMAAELAGVIPADRREVLGFVKDYLDDRVAAFDKSNLERIWRR
jgi:hypothetical protein